MSKPITEDLFTFSGRRNRKSFFLLSLIYILLGLISVFAFTAFPVIWDQPFLIVPFLIGFIVIVVSSLATCSQRARDFEWSGWSVLLIYIPVIGFIFACLWQFRPGTHGPNRYGPDPLSAPVSHPNNNAPPEKSRLSLPPENGAKPTFGRASNAAALADREPLKLKVSDLAPTPTASYAHAPAAQLTHTATNDNIYELIGNELAEGGVKTGLWTRLFAEANGDENRTKVLYIERRAEALKAEVEALKVEAQKDAVLKVEALKAAVLVGQVLKASFGYIVMLKDRSVLTEKNGKIIQYETIYHLRHEKGMDGGEPWPLITDHEEKLQALELFAEHLLCQP